MSTVLWTAAHIGTKTLLDEFRMMIESVNKVCHNLPIYVSASGLPIEDFETVITPNVHFIYSSERKLQFEHLNTIYRTFEFDPDDSILFVDSDDMLLSIPMKKAVRGGSWQLQMGISDTINYDDLLYLLADGVCPFRIIHDFTGYKVPYKWVKEYFEYEHSKNNQSLIAPLEDISFMQFMDAKGATILSIPHTYYRIHPHRGVPLWAQDIKKDADELIGSLRKLSPTKDIKKEIDDFMNSISNFG